MRLASVAMLVGGLALPAQATEWLYCNDPLNEAGVELLMGDADVPHVDSFTLRHNDVIWASDAAVGPGEPIQLGQSFGEGSRLDVDFLDASGALLAQLRLHHAVEAGLANYGGTLRIVGRGAWAVSCPGS